MRRKKRLGEILLLFVFSSLLVEATANSSTFKPTTVLNTTNVISKSNVFLVEDYLKLSHALPIEELQEALDILKFKYENLKHSTDIQHFNPRIYQTKNVYFTLFLEVINKDLNRILCDSMSLSPLDLQFAYTDFVPDRSVLLDNEVSFSKGNLFCISTYVVKKNEECLSYLIEQSKNKIFFKDTSSLQYFLQANFSNKTGHLVANATHFYFTDSPTGYTGCKNKMNAATANKHKNMQKIHSLFSMQLYETQSALLELLTQSLDKLSATVHSLATDDFVAPLTDIHSDLVRRIISKVPKYLPNYSNQQNVYPIFQDFFKKIVNTSLDIYIHKLADKDFLESLSHRSQQSVLIAVSQFSSSFKNRVKNMVIDSNPDISNTVLFKKNQNPLTFFYYVQGFFPEVDENMLIEIFITIQNCKSNLLQDISNILQLPVVAPHISRQDLEINKTLARSKRSWSSFWSAVWGSATEEEVQSLYKNEIDLSKHEMSMQQAVADVTGTNSELLNTFKTVSLTMDTLETKQKDLFGQIQQILGTEEGFFDSVEDAISVQDRSILLISEYLALNSQTKLTLISLNKLHSLITTALSGIVDISQIPTSSLREFLSVNLKLSLKMATTRFIFRNPGYVVEYTLPKLSKPFTVYKIEQVPYFLKNQWYQLSNISDTVVLNDLQEELIYSDVLAYCTPQNENFICPGKSLKIRKPVKTSCSIQLILAKMTEQRDFSNCLPQPIYLKTTQMYILKNNQLLLASPVESANLFKICSGKHKETIVLNLGLNLVNLDSKCHYETEEFIIKTYSASKLTIDTESDSEIELLDRTSKLDFVQNAVLTPSMTKLHDMIDAYKGSIKAEGKTVQELEKEISWLDSIDIISNFNPLKFNLSRPAHAAIWMTTLSWFAVGVLVYIIISVIHCLFPDFFQSIFNKSYNFLKSSAQTLCYRRNPSISRQVHFHEDRYRDSPQREDPEQIDVELEMQNMFSSEAV